MRTNIILEHLEDGGIIARLELEIGNQIHVILSGGNWEYENEEEAEVDEIWEVLFDAQEKGLVIDPRSINISREFTT